METTYRVVIKGAKDGVSVEQAVRQLAALFKATEDQIRPLITTPGNVVKKGVDIKTATQYLSAIEQAGAQAIVEPETTPDLQIDLPQQAMATGNAAAEVIPEKIRKNLAKYEKHINLTCLECGYVGLMGHVREEKKYRTPLVVISLIIILFFAVTNLVPSLYGYGFLTAYIPMWMKLGAGILIGVFIVKRSNILQCPNCEKELVQK
jgi:hypothetical protein